MSPSFLPFPLLSLILSVVLHSSKFVLADPALIPFHDCFAESNNVQNKLAVSAVYAQVLKNSAMGNYMNLTVFGTSPSEVIGMTNISSSLATIFTSTSVLTLSAWTNASYLCQTMRPPSPLPNITDLAMFTYCPLAPGPFAFSSTIPWGNNRELTTLNTRLRAVDPFGTELVCLDVTTTPLDPKPHSVYGKANIILWSTVGLTAAYWVVVGIARIVSAWNRGISRADRGVWSRAQSAGFILASAISGERLANSPALIRFCTPSMRDVIFHTQWCALLGMVAVEWPQFIYPLLTQTAWSTLAFNVSLTSGARHHHWDPLATPLFEPPSGYADQVSDIASPLYIDPTIRNILFTLPSDATHGMSSFAYTLGIRPQDLFPTSMILFLGIIAGTICLSGLIWFIDVFMINVMEKVNGHGSDYGPGSALTRLGGTRSPVLGAQTKGSGTGHESPPGGASIEEHKPLTTRNSGLFSKSPPGTPAGLNTSLSVEREQRDRGYPQRSWWGLRFRSDMGAFHGNVLHGNLVRILVWFHLPVTVFSCYQMTMSRSIASTTSVALAALSFVIFSILIPAHLVIRVTFTTTNKLYDETRTLLSLGPLYNHYRHGSQLFAILFFANNIAFGVTIGAGQKSGTAQAIVILVVEVISALVTSIWLPWGTGASMGLISFLFCVARIVIAVLLVILTPTISIGQAPGGWVAYGILIILALVYFALVLMLFMKLIEAFIRIVGGIGFDRSKHVADSGLIGAIGYLSCCRSRNKRKKRNTRRTSHIKGSNGKGSINPYKAGELGESPTSANNGRSSQRRNSDLSSYNPPAALLSNDSDRGSITPPRFLGSADSRKGSTNSQPPSVLRPEHANQPYREETDQDWWIQNEERGGAFIMGAWQPFGTRVPSDSGDVQSNLTVPSGHPHSLAVNRTNSALGGEPTTSSAPNTGFSRVGGGRAHIDSPYSIIPTGNAQLGSGQHGGSTRTFPSIGQQSTSMLSPSDQTSPQPRLSPPLQQQYPYPQQSSSTPDHPPSSFNYRPQNAPMVYVDSEDDPPIPVSSVRQALPASVPAYVQPQQHQAEIGMLPPGAMPPAHIRTKSQTAIVEDAGPLLYQSNQGNSSSQTGISARLAPSHRSSLQPIKIPSSGSRDASSASASGGLSSSSNAYHPPPSAPAKFSLSVDGDDDADSTIEDQQQKKKWYHLRRKRPHSSEGRTTTTSASNSSVPLAADRDLGVLGGGAAAGGEGTSGTQRSFVVIRKPMNSTGRLNQASALEASSSVASNKPGSPRSRPPTR